MYVVNERLQDLLLHLRPFHNWVEDVAFVWWLWEHKTAFHAQAFADFLPCLACGCCSECHNINITWYYWPHFRDVAAQKCSPLHKINDNITCIIKQDSVLCRHSIMYLICDMIHGKPISKCLKGNSALKRFNNKQTFKWSTKSDRSFVPRPHPLTRNIGLVNLVKFLWLAHPFASV